MATASLTKPDAATRVTELYEQHSAGVFRFALHLTGRREDAEDVVQAVFIQAFRTLEGGEDLLMPQAWLMRAARNSSLNLRRQKSPLLVDDIDQRAGVRSSLGIEEVEELAAVRAALWTLPESQHQAFVLRHWSGLSQNEIAEVLETSPSAVESLLVRARTALVENRDASDVACNGARHRLVNALALTSDQRTHLDSCRKCRAARRRLTRTAGFAASFALTPDPHVAHALASIIPGFMPTTAGAAAGGGVAAGSAAGIGTGGTTATLAVSAAPQVATAAKLGLAAKVALASLAAVVMASPPVRQPITAVLHHGFAATAPAPRHATRTVTPTHTSAPTAANGTGNGAAAGTDNGVGNGAGGGQAGNRGQGHAYGRTKHGATVSKGGGYAYGKTKHGAKKAKGGGHAYGKTAHGAGKVKTGKPAKVKKAQVNANNGAGKAKGHAPKTQGNGAAKGNKPVKPAHGNGPAKSDPNPNGNGGGNGNGGSNGNGNGHGKSAAPPTVTA